MMMVTRSVVMMMMVSSVGGDVCGNDGTSVD